MSAAFPAAWNAMTHAARVALLKRDHSMRSAQWAPLVARMAATDFESLSTLQQDAVRHLLGGAS